MALAGTSFLTFHGLQVAKQGLEQTQTVVGQKALGTGPPKHVVRDLFFAP